MTAKISDGQMTFDDLLDTRPGCSRCGCDDTTQITVTDDEELWACARCGTEMRVIV
ncbi:hypothetical protein [Actinomadura kijaniata]|uniref:hypothetical protein n=1 Tax=Actinomadura kijaniata TaxID=46161 RepID=UPI000A99317A|nr:hypothetical protein [Actinomadura kijaniata]